MALFQASVLNTYLKLQQEEKLAKAFKKFSKYFHHPEIQENIRNSKEEQFQATFLNELFVNVLGYTLNPNPSFDLTTEFKNEKNSRKADGAILIEGKAIGVIELKGTNTKHLEGIRQQAFDYKANQKGCIYVVTSNFEKLRFYINDATEFVEFDLFELSRKDFDLLYLCLHKENITSNLALKIKEFSIVKEEQITKEFYKDYSVFKRELFRDLVKLNAKTLKNIRLHDPEFSGVEESNPDYAKSQAQILRLEKNVKLELFKKSQKLIDRFLFIFFAEDRNLLPPNSTIQIVKEWEKLKDMDAVFPLYDRFKLYFSYLDQGRKGSASKAEIYAYNGGLFKPDNLLDRLAISDTLLAKHTTQLSKYDFASQVDVNILGHIFENSLNEIETVSAEIEGADFDKQKSKRKKDGVFYTPKYITKYIVENTVGKLCEEKKTELGFREEEYFKGRKQRQTKTLEGLIKILDDYRAWLLQLTICDPACGSGAFLNQALDFLIKEHRYIDEMKAKLLGGGLVFSDIETTILENNIYGVDINEESVEIAKLSLWLRTAQPRRKLNDLSSNIKCGNSLIDDRKVAGNKAFKWEEEFSDVFDKGGFDVVIGNPPYVVLSSFESTDFIYLQNKFVTAFGRLNLFSLFVEQSAKLINLRGKVGLIIPDSLCLIDYYKDLRLHLIKNTNIISLIEIGDGVFEDATVPALIIVFEALIKKNNEILVGFGQNFLLGLDDSKFIEQDLFLETPKNSFNLHADKIFTKLHKICKTDYGYKLNDLLQIKIGICTGNNKKHLQPGAVFPNSKKVLQGRDINRYSLNWGGNFVNYSKNELLRSRDEDIFLKEEKLLMRQTSDKLILAYDDSQYYTIDSLFVIYPKSDEIELKYALALMNSKLLNRQYQKLNPEAGRVFAQVKIDYVNEIPLILPEKNIQQVYVDLVDLLSSKTLSHSNLNEKFGKFIKTTLNIEKLTKSLENYFDLTFGEFIKELNKAIKSSNKQRAKVDLSHILQLTKKDEFEWMELFEENKKKAVELQQQISATNKDIDQMVYELYGLTEEEIKIVEQS